MATPWRWFLLVFVSGLFILIGAPHIRAHAELLAAQPAPGSRLYRAPAQIQLTFNEPIGSNSTLVVFSSNFRHVNGVEVIFDPDTPEQLVATLPSLTPGVYTVQWTVVSADSDVISGSYAFQVTGSLLNLVDGRSWLLIGTVILFGIALVSLVIRWRKKHPTFIVVLLILLLTLPETPIHVRAHGMGTPQKINEPAGPYLVSIWTDPDPLRVDEVHVTVAVTDRQTQAPILDSRVTVQLASLEEESVSLSAPATQENSPLKFLYVAVFEPPFAGPWRGTVIVDGPDGSGEPVSFDIDVLPPAPFNWLWVGTGGLGVLLAFWLARSWLRTADQSHRLPARKRREDLT